MKAAEVKILPSSDEGKTSGDVHADRRLPVRGQHATGNDALLLDMDLDRLVESFVLVPPLGLAETCAGRDQVQPAGHRDIVKPDPAFEVWSAIKNRRQCRIETWKSALRGNDSQLKSPRPVITLRFCTRTMTFVGQIPRVPSLDLRPTATVAA